jgi:hypothetical protein
MGQASFGADGAHDVAVRNPNFGNVTKDAATALFVRFAVFALQRNRLQRRRWLLPIVGALTAPTFMALTCRWRSRPQHQKRTLASIFVPTTGAGARRSGGQAALCARRLPRRFQRVAPPH